MEKICPICGKTLSEDTTVCSKCGAAVSAATATPNPAPVDDFEFLPEAELPVADAPVEEVPAAPKKPLSKKTKTIIGIAAGAVVLLLIVVAIIGNISTPKTAFNNYLSALNGDLSKYEQLAPAEYWEFLAERRDISKAEMIDDMKDYYKQNLAWLEEYYGPYNVTGKILDETDMDAETLDMIADFLLKHLNVQKSDITEGKLLNIELSYSGSKNSYNGTSKMYAIKIDSSWYIVSYDAWSIQGIVSFPVS